MINFSFEELNKTKKDVLPTKQERKEKNKLKEQIERDRIRIGQIVSKFYNEEIAPLNLPIWQVKEDVPQALKSIIDVAITSSTLYREELKFKRNNENIKYCDLQKA